MFITTHHTFAKAKASRGAGEAVAGDRFRVIAGGKEHEVVANKNAVKCARRPVNAIGPVEAPDAPVLIAQTGVTSDQIKSAGERFQLEGADVHRAVNTQFVTAFEAQKISTVSEVEKAGDSYFAYATHDTGEKFRPGDSGTPFFGTGDNKKKIAVHSGISAGRGLLMILKTMPPLVYEYEKATDGGFAVRHQCCWWLPTHAKLSAASLESQVD